MTKKQNILFYIPTISQEWGGVRQYAAGLMELFPLLEEKYNFFILHDGNDSLIMDAISRSNNVKLINPQDFHSSKIQVLKNKFVIVYNFIRNKKNLEKIDLNNLKLMKIIEKHNISIIHCPYQFIPKVKGIKLITTLHDVQELYFPEFFTAEER